eukprot:365735-Chlamydomonas_euryale.AAC.4
MCCLWYHRRQVLLAVGSAMCRGKGCLQQRARAKVEGRGRAGVSLRGSNDCLSSDGDRCGRDVCCCVRPDHMLLALTNS